MNRRRALASQTGSYRSRVALRRMVEAALDRDILSEFKSAEFESNPLVDDEDDEEEDPADDILAAIDTGTEARAAGEPLMSRPRKSSMAGLMDAVGAESAVQAVDLDDHGLDDLVALKAHVRAADRNGNGSLDEAEFVQAVGAVHGHGGCEEGGCVLSAAAR